MDKIIYGSQSVFERHINWNTYRMKLLNKQPLWWILEALHLDKRPKGYSKEKLVYVFTNELWEEFLEGLDRVEEE